FDVQRNVSVVTGKSLAPEFVDRRQALALIEKVLGRKKRKPASSSTSGTTSKPAVTTSGPDEDDEEEETHKDDDGEDGEFDRAPSDTKTEESGADETKEKALEDHPQPESKEDDQRGPKYSFSKRLSHGNVHVECSEPNRRHQADFLDDVIAEIREEQLRLR